MTEALHGNNLHPNGSRTTTGFERIDQVQKRIDQGLPVGYDPVLVAERIEEIERVAARGTNVTWEIAPETEWTFGEEKKADPEASSAIGFPATGGITLTAEPRDPYVKYQAPIILEPADLSHPKAAKIPQTGELFVAKVIRPIEIKAPDKPNQENPINNGNNNTGESKSDGHRKHGKKGKTHDTTGLTGFWRGTLYINGVPVKNLPKPPKAK